MFDVMVVATYSSTAGHRPQLILKDRETELSFSVPYGIGAYWEMAGRLRRADWAVWDKALENLGEAQSIGELELDGNDLSGLASFRAA